MYKVLHVYLPQFAWNWKTLTAELSKDQIQELITQKPKNIENS